MVDWRKFTATVGGAALTVGVLAVAPGLAEEREQRQTSMAAAAVAGGIEIWGSTTASYPEADGPWSQLGTHQATAAAGAQLVIRADGTLQALPGTAASLANIPAAVSSTTVVDAGVSHVQMAWAVTADGNLHKWGGSRGTVVPDGTFTPDALEAPGKKVIEATGSGTGAGFLVRFDDGSVTRVDGVGPFAPLNDGEPLTDVTMLAGTMSSSVVPIDFALRSDGSIVAVDYDQWSTVVPADAADPVVDIAVQPGASTSMVPWGTAVRASGEVFAFDQNGAYPDTGFAELGGINGTPVQVARAGGYAAALTDAGDVHIWAARTAGSSSVPENFQPPASLQGMDVLDIESGNGLFRAIVTESDDPQLPPLEVTDGPSITGTPQVGQTLTATPATFNETEGVTLSHQWLADGEPIAGATNVTYALTAAEEGATITYVTTATRAADGAELASQPSNALGPVEGVELPEFTVEEQPTIEGDTQVGETITATPATFSDTEGVTVEHQWYADDTLIEGANGPTLTLDRSHEGAMISYATKGTRTIDGAEATSERTEEIGPVVPVELMLTGQPTITGRPFIGEELTVTPAPVTDDRADITYQWYVGEGEEFTPIEGATETTLELTEELRDLHVMVEQIATRSLDGARASGESIAVGPVTDAPVELTVETEAGLTGTPRVGQTLTGTPATFSTTENVTVTNYWVIGNQEIEATGNTLVLTNDHVRQNIQFKSVATRGDEAVPSVSPTVGPVLVVLAPTAKPTIAGTPQVGQTLTGTPATFNDTQGVTVANRWLADGQPISGATSTTFTLTEAQFGKVITFESTATRGADTANSVSDPTGQVTRAPLTVTSKPTISGDARVGQTLTGTPAVYSATEGVTITNRWLADGQPIDGATGTTLELTGEHLGRTITFESIAQRGDEDPVSSVSDPKGPVLPEEDQEPSGEVVIDLDGPTAPGSTIRVSVGTDFAGQQVQLYLSNLDRLLGGVTVGEDGFIEVKVPGDIPLGEHTLAVYDENGDLIGWDNFSVSLALPEDPALKDAITVTPDTVAPGQEVVITVGQQYAGQMVRVVLFSAPRDLGFFQVAADGTIRVQIPSDVTPGEHRIAVYDADGNLIGWQDITVTGDAAAGGGVGSGVAGRGMGNFGADSPEFLAPLGLAILLAGAVTLGAGWRRRQQLS
ncbi:hypothetical protein EHW97_14920 [Aeromicrobium camelliae]|uniref:Uncharacterized protein n=1 Tax=Aeromicrobium camelliae TaxID=1538144 RepID=A0A3N6WKZ1_9ACTN|nr:hypothetical protein [Aeromicrobium camelliae]RQN01983.1 hypothetical protein EHW97_14920 [Aeromicrobium camelliae]